MSETSLQKILKDNCSDIARIEMLESALKTSIDTAIKSGAINPKSVDANTIESVLKTVLECTTEHQNVALEDLVLEREKIERQITQQSEELQEFRKTAFNTLETLLNDGQYEFSKASLNGLHNLKLQNLDILEVLKEVTESALVTTLEKTKNSLDIHKTVIEIAKNLTLQTLNEGILSSARIRKVLNSIIDAAIEVSEASPPHAKEILSGTVHGMRKGLIAAISRFQERFENTPDEAKKLLLEDMQMLFEDLHHADVLFMQTLKTKASNSSAMITSTLTSVVNSTSDEMGELINVSREAIELMRDKLSFLAQQTLERSSVLKDKATQESKRLGIRIWESAKTALEGAIKSAKDVLDSSQEEREHDKKS